MNRIAAHLSPATAISMLALFVSLGGVSYAVATGSIDSRAIKNNDVRSIDIRNNSVRTQDLRNNDVRSIDIRNGTIRGRDVAQGTLTGAHINEAKLDKVPSAADSDRLGGRDATAYAPAKPEPVRLVGTADGPAFGQDFSPAPAPDLPPGFWKDPFGSVHLQGTVADSDVDAGVAEVLFTLPAGYRPAGTARFVGASGPGALSVGADGAVTVIGGPALIPLDGVYFRAAE